MFHRGQETWSYNNNSMEIDRAGVNTGVNCVVCREHSWCNDELFLLYLNCNNTCLTRQHGAIATASLQFVVLII